MANRHAATVDGLALLVVAVATAFTGFLGDAAVCALMAAAAILPVRGVR